AIPLACVTERACFPSFCFRCCVGLILGPLVTMVIESDNASTAKKAGLACSFGWARPTYRQANPLGPMTSRKTDWRRPVRDVRPESRPLRPDHTTYEPGTASS